MSARRCVRALPLGRYARRMGLGGGWRLAVLLALAGCGRTDVLQADGGFSGSFDDGGADDVGGGRGEQLCREVDILFVIDDSPTMAEYQDNVVANYDVFIRGIEEAIETLDTLHIGVIAAGNYHDNDNACDSIGGLVVRTGGRNSSNATCGPYAEGKNYMTQRDDLDSAFPCAATLGTDGTDHDTPMAAILAAISPPLTDPGQCNHGFINPGALLVVVIVTDTYPNNFGVVDHDPYFVASSVASAVGGFDDVVVVLIASTEESPCLNPLAPGLETFAGLFDHSFVGGICEPDYSQLFDPAIDVVKGACPG